MGSQGSLVVTTTSEKITTIAEQMGLKIPMAEEMTPTAVQTGLKIPTAEQKTTSTE